MLRAKDDRLHNVFILNWEEVLGILYPIKPRLAKRMQENARALKDLPFFMVNYPYGAKIIHNRDVRLPLVGGDSISFNDPSLPDILREHLSYTPGFDNPVGMILNKEAEFYLERGKRIVSYPVIKTGQTFGFAHIVDAVMNENSETGKKAYVSIWNLNAGARTAFILPKVSENQKHANLLETYGINVEKPSLYTEQQNVFRALNASIDDPWVQPVIYFPKQLLKMLKTGKCPAIYQEMSNIHRSGYNIWHTTYSKWEGDINYVFEESKANALSSYAVSIAKHIYLIVAGGVPGFAPAIDENMLPKKLIEDAYAQGDGYGLTEYWPFIMQPKQFNAKESVYYSLGLPSLINYNPNTFKGKTQIELLSEIVEVLRLSQKYILNKFEDRESILYDTARKARFSFYHDDPNPDKYGQPIKSSALLPKEDSRFFKKGWAFPYLSQFVRSCIKIEPVA
ncbi:MAG: hypothetical protein K0R14_1504 [Burkholderiales bacterium]|jgi:hypothetical protein|nr:hypothetical protein [Burkholderiales bacterium]